MIAILTNVADFTTLDEHFKETWRKFGDELLVTVAEQLNAR